eukprot:CAMPEP_0197535798 /NCGR_PEP_ID=MMETSP1318-20131121/51716_1 /TAXON_ID=552666 /ORGANISM="Partenskyella glossopodia, Strain RCC365" /LENGTH=378 /DNA_ID=CAMNT_0043093481 /DNA_START=191 /DNA_END=1327 /DNA_ORIENTATION=+
MGKQKGIGEDAEVVFEEAWSKLVSDLGEEKMHFPKEIMWLGGAPGAGKGTNTGFIMRERGYTEAPIVVSSLLNSPEMLAIKASGGLVGDKEVISVLFRELLDPKYQSGVVVDGFPRTKVQAHVVHDLCSRLMHLRNKYKTSGDASKAFARPIFRICVLYVDEDESIRRQLGRGEKAQLHNEKVKATGKGELEELRPTDFDPSLARKRYQAFQDSTLDALEFLGEFFIYNLIIAQGSFAEVESSIVREMEYQSSQELNPETHDMIHHLPRADEISIHARQNLVKRLDSYAMESKDDLMDVVNELETEIYRRIEANVIAGKCSYPVPAAGWDATRVQIALDVLSDRGFRASSHESSSNSDSDGSDTTIAIEWDPPRIRKR